MGTVPLCDNDKDVRHGMIVEELQRKFESVRARASVIRGYL